MNTALVGHPPAKRSTRTRFAVLILAIGIVLVAYLRFGDQLTLESLASREVALRQFQQDRPVLIYGLAFGLYVCVTGLSLPGALGLTLAYSWYFDLIPAVILISFASTTGASLAFLFSRYLFRTAVQDRFGGRLAALDDALQREGAYYLFLLRLVVVVPFFIINLVMGLTPMRLRTFWWVSQLGMLPATVVYCFVGSSFPDLTTLASRGLGEILSLRLLIAFALLGLFPLLVRYLVHRLRSSKAPSRGGDATTEPV
jgi:uncharacterized membrane protein YdjX (TVP38/TMEM64 family)